MQYFCGFIPILIGIPRSPVPNAFGIGDENEQTYCICRLHPGIYEYYGLDAFFVHCCPEYSG